MPSGIITVEQNILLRNGQVCNSTKNLIWVEKNITIIKKVEMTKFWRAF